MFTVTEVSAAYDNPTLWARTFTEKNEARQAVKDYVGGLQAAGQLTNDYLHTVTLNEDYLILRGYSTTFFIKGKNWEGFEVKVDTRLFSEGFDFVSADTLPFNDLTLGEAELLHILAEEAGEVVQATMKVLRHGLFSINPNSDTLNKTDLCREIGDFSAMVNILVSKGILDAKSISDACANKLKVLGEKRYTHHQ